MSGPASAPPSRSRREEERSRARRALLCAETALSLDPDTADALPANLEDVVALLGRRQESLISAGAGNLESALDFTRRAVDWLQRMRARGLLCSSTLASEHLERWLCDEMELEAAR